MIRDISGENFDERGLSIDYIIYYWFDYKGASHPLRTGVINYSKSIKDNMFSDNNRLVIKGAIYPNTYKIINDDGSSLSENDFNDVLFKKIFLYFFSCFLAFSQATSPIFFHSFNKFSGI